jgi:BCCT, betaine/carnitine/choline family transporter
VATSAVFGQFVARISRGRRIWEVCFHSLVGPFLYTLVWFCIWGGIGLRHSRQAMELERLGESLSNSTAHFVHDGNEFCYDVPQEDILVDGEVVFTNHLPGVTPVCMFDAENPHSAIFNVLNSFSFPNNFGQGGGFGSSLSVLLLLGSAVFFMAGAGAASTIIDKIASSGRKNNHLARRMFWLITAAALATALLSTGGEAVLTAVQAAMIICGLPFSILLCYALQCMMQMCRQAAEHQGERDYRFPTQPEFSMPVYGGIFNVLEYCASLGKVAQSRLDRGMGNTTSFHVMEAAKGLLVPFLALRQVLLFTHPQNPKTNFALVVGYAITYVSWIGLCFASLRWTAWAGVAWTFCIVHGIALAFVRSAFRTRFNIRSNTLADVISSTLFWPQVLIQMHQHCLECSAASTKGLKPEACREIEIEI